MRSRSTATLAAVLAALLLPAAAAGHPPPNTPQPTGFEGRPIDRSEARSGITEVGFHPLLGAGFNTDVWGQVTGDDRLIAYSGTWGTAEGFADPGEACPSQADDALDPRQSGVKVVDATDPAEPELIAKLGSAPGAQNNDVKVAKVSVPGFDGDLLAHSLEPCGAEGLAFQVAGPPLTDPDVPQTGFQLYDVSEPSEPKRLGTYNNGGIGTHNLFLYERADLDRAFVAAVYNEVGLLSDIRGELQIVEVTDPSSPRVVGTWELADAGLPCEARGGDSAHCYLHDVWVSQDGRKAYLSYWDAGMVVLDVSNPESPQFAGRAQDQVEGDGTGWLDEEGNTHVAVPYRVRDRELVVIGDEDFTGGPSPQVKVSAPAELASDIVLTQWTGTAPVDGQHGALAYAGSGCTAANYAGVAGKIALVDSRQSATNPADRCPTYLFAQKVQAAEKAGAVALVQIPREGEEPFSGSALAGEIPAGEIPYEAGARLRDAVLAGTTVEATLDRGLPVDPWGFARVVDITSADPAEWREVDRFKAPHVDSVEQPAQSVFSAHNPIVGDDGRIYFAWYTDGVRVLEPKKDGSLREVAWFAPLASDHEGDLDQDPHGAQEDNVGFWGSFPVCHPRTGEQLILNSDLNRGLYILRVDKARCRPGATFR
jgi:hypothetical protein